MKFPDVEVAGPSGEAPDVQSGGLGRTPGPDSPGALQSSPLQDTPVCGTIKCKEKLISREVWG